jgi:hypothetical protein
VSEKLSRRTSSSTPAIASPLELPPCPKCGGAISFAANPGNAIEWWRCTKCSQFFPVRRGGPCLHSPQAATRCAVCGGAATAVSVVIRKANVETTLHFCSALHAAEALDAADPRKEDL